MQGTKTREPAVEIDGGLGEDARGVAIYRML
jgi:hypothetical protein